jgi:hypothetical protein
VALVGWFSWAVWSHREVWSNVYVLHDTRRSESERIIAAYALSRDPRVNQRQLWDMCLREPLPPLARYVLAEALTAEAASADPRNYALTVARSTGWPDWLRLLLVRPIAAAASKGVKFPREPLDELRRHPDPGVNLWANTAVALMEPNGPMTGTLDQACRQDASTRELACLLARAVQDRDRPEKVNKDLDEATTWVREHHPGASDLWDRSGWEIRDGRLVQRGSQEP